MTVQNIFDFLNLKFPVCTACDFDNVGILVGDSNQEVKKTIISLDCTIETVKKAVENNCELIITHHPIIFNPLKNVLSDSVVFQVIRNNISVISMHTNLDIGIGGVNDSLCEFLNPINCVCVKTDDSYSLKKCTVSPISADDLADKLKISLGGAIKYTTINNSITDILVCSGSGGNYLAEAIKNNCQAFITADIKHSQFLEASHNNIALFDAGHFNTEDVVIEPLKKVLSQEFCKIEFITDHTNLIKSR